MGSSRRMLFLGALFTAGGLAGFGLASGIVLTHSPSNGTASIGLPGSSSQKGGSGKGGTGAPSPSSPPSDTVDSPDAIAQSVDPAVVDINGTLSGGGEVSGTGMVISSSGLVLTNNHVIEDTTKLSLQIDGNGQTYTATVLGTDATDDIALLQLNGASNL
jgi:S1-C subfamily serine protease